MSRNIVNDYILYDKDCINNYLKTIAVGKIDDKLIETIVETYVDIRYYDLYDHMNDSVTDTLEYYVRSNTEKILRNDEKKMSDTKIKRNINLAVWLIKYIMYFEKATTDRKILKLLDSLEDELKKKFTEVPENLRDELFTLMKNNSVNKKKSLNRMKCRDFKLDIKETNVLNTFDVVLKHEIKIPDLFSEVAIDRVFDKGIISEDKLLVLFTLVSIEILNNILNYNYSSNYLIEFNCSLFTKRNKISNLFKIIDLDLLKDKINFKITYSEFATNKDYVYEYIHNGYKFAVIIDDSFDNNMQLLEIFSYIIIDKDKPSDDFAKYNNVILR